MRRGYFVLYGLGGELDRKSYDAGTDEQLKEQFLEWIKGIILAEDDVIKIESE